MRTLPDLAAEIPYLPLECIAESSPRTFIVALFAYIPYCVLSWNSQLLNVADVELDVKLRVLHTLAPY